MKTIADLYAAPVDCLANYPAELPAADVQAPPVVTEAPAAPPVVNEPAAAPPIVEAPATQQPAAKPQAKRPAKHAAEQQPAAPIVEAPAPQVERPQDRARYLLTFARVAFRAACHTCDAIARAHRAARGAWQLLTISRRVARRVHNRRMAAR